MDTSKLVVVASDGENYGSTTFWEGTGASVQASEANKGLLPDGIPAPSAPSPVAALQRAMSGLAGVRNNHEVGLSRPYGKTRAHGKRALVVERSDESGLTHSTSFLAETVRIEGVGDAEATYELKIHGATPEQEAGLRAAYERALGQLEPTDLASWLVKEVVPVLDGVSLRKHGGFYYIPPQAQPRLAAVKAFIRATFVGAVVHSLPTVRSEEAVAAVTSAIVQEIQDLCLDFAEKSADGKYGKRALKARELDLENAKAKLARYEALLGAALPQVHEQIEEVTGAICAAQLAEMATAAE